MNNYIGKVCPFCKTKFTENDEIVVCNKCDMPHHKDCWINNQGCTTFGCTGTIKTADISSNSVTSTEIQYDDVAERFIYCSKCGTQSVATKSFCSRCGNPLNSSVNNVNQTYIQPNSSMCYTENQNNYNTYYQQQTTMYGNVSLDPDFLIYVGQNHDYYLRKFLELKNHNKKISWNWCAFFVTPYWLMYRKMYSYAIGVLGVLFFLALIGNTLTSLISLAGYILFGMFGNYIYMQYVEKKISHSSYLNEPYKSQYILKSGGVSSTAVILTVIGYTFLMVFCLAV